ncbi:protein-disulfide reductase DsbD family protein [Aureliella helgolandensis]|uniref:Thiol:disulfide interchange protein DsbD n=1 Tax=Aureliella helgolandensis TaxID=2527968 RepID=A0A518G120_9BACT|nr:thioredoxin family protein [Aureliella helgolandensis]QDV22276.1 Thiol:disulfide interchange protein DsbD precursor [Aureliella helgolandensis]
MLKIPSPVRSLGVLALLLWVAAAQTAVAQKGKGSPFGGLGLPSVGSAAQAGPKVSYRAEYSLNRNGQEGRLSVFAEVADGFHTYSTTQAEGGPLPTAIEVEGEQIKLSGPFVADHEPTLALDDVWPGLEIQEYHGQVVWTAPFAVLQEFAPEKTTFKVQVDALVCGEGSCVPAGDTVEAAFKEHYAAEAVVTEFRPEKTHAIWSAELSHQAAAPGSEVTLTLTANTDAGYHVYRYVPGDTAASFRTLIVAKRKAGLKFGTPVTDTKLVEIDAGLDAPEYYYDGPTTWKIPVRIPESAKPGEYPLELLVGFYTCNDRSCDPSAGVAINGKILVAEQSQASPAPFALTAADFNAVAELPNLASWIDTEGAIPKSALQQGSTATVSLTLMHLLAALAGGFILNFMPCVLPVIGLKVMSFANQAGSSHRRVVELNLAFVAGIVGVMLVLAIATIAAKVISGSAFGWGQQFTSLEFKVALAALVFAMALSFLGVWEIPIPGFAMSSKSGELMEKEGLLGAFLKGILTTVLATPCSGPLLGALFGLSLTLSSASVLLLYLVVGIGMALPYLALCFYPGFIKLLPKPGPWMETLKQVLAFPLLLTVVFFVTAIDSDHRIATLILLIVVWFACWLVGQVPAYSNPGRIWMARGASLITIALGVFVSFTYFGPLDAKLPWVDYNEAHLAQLRREGKTVMVDFTANWCLNCQINMRVAIDKEGVSEIVHENNVVPMVADWTGNSPEIREKLEELQSNSIPLLVIYPPDGEPILLRDLITESQVIDALKEAGPSRSPSRLASLVN